MGDSALARSIKNQRRTIIFAGGLIVACLWISLPLGQWLVGLFAAAGIVLGLLNHLGTEVTLLRSLDEGDLLSRKQFAMSSLLRLMLVSLVALVLAVVFWPDGAAVLIGLALFHLIALVFTGLPLLKEMRNA